MHSEYMYYGKSLLRVPAEKEGNSFMCTYCHWENSHNCPLLDRKKFKDIPACVDGDGNFTYVHNTKENHEKYKDVLKY